MRAGPRWLGAGLLAAFCILVGLEPPPLGRVRDAMFDTYQRLMPREARSAPAVIVEIDEHTLEKSRMLSASDTAFLPFPRN